MELVNRFFQKPLKSYFLFGPRGTGKSTYLKSIYPAATFIDLLEPDTFRQFRAFPERLKTLVEGEYFQKLFVIDEVQKVPERRISKDCCQPPLLLRTVLESFPSHGSSLYKAIVNDPVVSSPIFSRFQ